jgi:hypothetical protein
MGGRRAAVMGFVVAVVPTLASSGPMLSEDLEKNLRWPCPVESPCGHAPRSAGTFSVSSPPADLPALYRDGTLAVLQMLLASSRAATELLETEIRNLLDPPGNDTRRLADWDDACAPSVARVATAKGRSTGVFATDQSRAWSIVIGAAHALVDERGEPVDEAMVTFPNREHSRAKLLWLGAAGEAPDRLSTHRDIAVMMLDHPPKNIRPMEVRYEPLPSEGVSLIAFHGDFQRGMVPALSEECRTEADDRHPALVRHSCFTRPGASGGPLFVRQGEHCAVGAIHVARAGKDDPRHLRYAVRLQPYEAVLGDIFRKAKAGVSPKTIRFTLRER